MLSATTLVCEACVVFFATLVAHGLAPDSRIVNWIVGLGLVAALALTPSMFRSGRATGYWVGAALQLGVIAYGLVVPAMAIVGLVFAVLYLVGVIQGRRMDREKDQIDRAVLAQEGADGG